MHHQPLPKYDMRLNGGRVSSNASDTESTGLSRATDALKTQGYAVESVDWNDLHTSHASLLVIPSPTQLLRKEGLNQITQFLGRGGRLLIMSDPSNSKSLDGLVPLWGIQLGKGIIADEQDRLGFAKQYLPGIRGHQVWCHLHSSVSSERYKTLQGILWLLCPPPEYHAQLLNTQLGMAF